MTRIRASRSGHSKAASPILSVEDLRDEVHPFFGSKIGRLTGVGLMKALRVSELNEVHSDYTHLRGTELTTAVLQDPRVNVSYTIHGGEHLKALKKMGAFFTVSNHPFGGLDGLILLDIMLREREDFMVLVNGMLNKISALSKYWIPVKPIMKDREHDPQKNISGLRMVADRVQGGHPVGMFPAGGLPHYQKRYGQPMEIPWKLNNVRIMKRAGIPVLPIMFEGNNSRRYYRFGERWGYDTASILIPRELFNKKGEEIEVYIGAPIMPDELSHHKDLSESRDYLMRQCLGILPSYKGRLDYLQNH